VINRQFAHRSCSFNPSLAVCGYWYMKRQTICKKMFSFRFFCFIVHANLIFALSVCLSFCLLCYVELIGE